MSSFPSPLSQPDRTPAKIAAQRYDPGMKLLLRLTRKLIETILVATLGAYLGACGILFFVQNRLIFFPSATLTQTPGDINLTYEDVWIPIQTTTPEGNPITEKLHNWWIPAPGPSRGVILHFHGNGANISANLGQAQKFHRLGYDVLMVEYRGYGRSDGTFPSETSVYQDATAAWTYLTQTRKIPAQNIFIFGHSLGGAIAIELASRQPQAAGLIVQSSFSRMSAMVEKLEYHQLFPISLLLIHRFDSLKKVPQLKMPVLYIHGTADELVPPHMSQTLFDASPEPKEILIVEGGFHNNVQDIGAETYQDTVATFLEQATARQEEDDR